MWKVGKEVFDGFEGEAFGGDFGGEGVVQEFYCVVEGTDLSYFVRGSCFWNGRLLTPVLVQSDVGV